MDPEGPTRPSPDAQAWMLTGVLGVAVVALALLATTATQVDDTVAVPWALLALGVALAERYRVHLHVGRETHTFTLAELPTVIGLFLVSPLGVIVARLVGTAVAMASVHRRQPLKLAFNVASGTLEAAVAVVAFHLLLPLVGQDTTWTYVAALGAMLAGSVLGVVMVWAVIRLVEGNRGLAELGSSMAAGLPLSVANASIALFVVALLRIRPEMVWIALLPVAVLVVTYRAYIGQWRHRNGLDFLYDTAVEAQGATEPDDALLVLVERARDHLGARTAELVAVPETNGDRITGTSRAIVVSAGPGSAHGVRTCTLDELSPQIRVAIEGTHAPSGRVDPEEVWARAEGSTSGPLVLHVRGPIGNAVTFDETDLDVVRSLTRLVTMTLDRAQLAELKAAFLSAVSHELRTPLTVVLGTASTLRARDQQLAPDDRARLLVRLEEQASRLDLLLSDLLDLDRLNRGVIEARRRLVDLVPLAERAVQTVDVQHHDVRITTETLLADVDPSLTERILENLVKNAVKYSPPDTTVTIGIERHEDHVLLHVDDEGEGVPPDLRTSILEPFTRIDRHHPQPGTGIGLTLVRRFAQLHGGDVWIEDSPAGGARVVVRLQDAVVPDRPQERLLTA